MSFSIKLGKETERPNALFPVLAKWKPSGEIVLFSRTDMGVRVQASKPEDVGLAGQFTPISDPRWEILPRGTKLTIRNR